MKFEQAFYTRGTNQLNNREAGLGICASSNVDKRFLDKCMSIGGMFNTERSDDTAQFVIYSEAFDTFVGVGVSPAFNSDGGVVNKLCHFYIPIQENEENESLRNPEEYYLDYPYLRNVEKGSTLGIMELSPCFHVDNFSEICRKNGFNREKLAYLLFKVFPILFNEKNLLHIVIDEKVHDKQEFAEIAREITWLISRMVPGLGEEALGYRRRLSYGVYSRENISIVNLIYSADESLHTNCFYLDKDSDAEIPELYFALADKALESNESYMEMIRQLLECKMESNVSSRSILILYFRWKLNQGFSITQSEIPFSIENLIYRAYESNQYKILLWDIILWLEDIELEDLVEIWSKNIRPQFEYLENIDTDKFCKVVEKVTSLMYEKSQKNYRICLRKFPDELKSQLELELYQQEDSCIRKHLDELSDAEQFMEAFYLYEPLGENEEYFAKMQELAKRYYFEVDSKERDELSKIFLQYNPNSWEVFIKKILESCSLEQISEFSLKSFSATLKRYWCEKIIEQLDRETMTETVRDSLISQLQFLRELDDESKAEYMDAIWDACEEDMASRLVCSLAWGTKEYSVWEVVPVADFKKYEEIYANISKRPRYFAIENEKLLQEDKKQVELNRVCYVLWKQIVKGKICDLNVLDSCDLVRFQQDVLCIIEMFETFVKDRAEDWDCITYFRMELKKEEPWAGLPESTVVRRCQEYEKIREEAFDLYKKIAKGSYRGQSAKIAERVEEFQVFARLLEREPVQSENIDTMAKLRYEAKNYLGMEIEQVRILDEEYQIVFHNIEDEIQNIDIENQELNKRIQRNNELKNRLMSKRQRAKSFDQYGKETQTIFRPEKKAKLEMTEPEMTKLEMTKPKTTNPEMVKKEKDIPKQELPKVEQEPSKETFIETLKNKFSKEKKYHDL